MAGGKEVMNLRTWPREHTKPTEAELAQRKAQLIASYKQGRLDERYALLAQLAAEQQAKRAIDRALTPNPDYHPGDVVRKWNQINKPGYKSIRLLPDPARQTTDSFPWLPDEHRLNGAPTSALVELSQLVETEVRLKAVKAP